MPSKKQKSPTLAKTAWEMTVDGPLVYIHTHIASLICRCSFNESMKYMEDLLSINLSGLASRDRRVVLTVDAVPLTSPYRLNPHEDEPVRSSRTCFTSTKIQVRYLNRRIVAHSHNTIAIIRKKHPPPAAQTEIATLQDTR